MHILSRGFDLTYPPTLRTETYILLNRVRKDGLRSLLLVATSLDDECQYNAAVIYRKLCADQHTHDYVVGRGGLQALLGLVQLRGLGTQRQAAAALRDLCSNKEHKARIPKNNAQYSGL